VIVKKIHINYKICSISLPRVVDAKIIIIAINHLILGIVKKIQNELEPKICNLYFVGKARVQ
jgi:hypothetical protein